MPKLSIGWQNYLSIVNLTDIWLQSDPCGLSILRFSDTYFWHFLASIQDRSLQIKGPLFCLYYFVEQGQNFSVIVTLTKVNLGEGFFFFHFWYGISTHFLNYKTPTPDMSLSQHSKDIITLLEKEADKLGCQVSSIWDFRVTKFGKAGSGFLTLGVSCTKSKENAPKGTCL